MTDPNDSVQPVDEPVHSQRAKVGEPQDNPTSDLTDADREWLDQHRSLAHEYYGTQPVADQPGVVTRPDVRTDVAANQQPAPVATPDEPKDELDKSRPYYRIVHADGSESFQNGDLAIPTHGGDDGHAVTAAYLLPAENTDNK
jgi:hypothetical protein